MTEQYNHKYVKWIGTTNTEIKIGFPTSDMQDLNIFLSCGGGNLNNSNMTIQVSNDDSDWSANVDSLALGTGATYAKYYNINNVATAVPVNPVSFPWIRITIPAQGAGKTVTARISGKTMRPYYDASTGTLPITDYGT
jgi:hypothetical protein